MAWGNDPVSLEHDDEEKYDLARGMPDGYEPPDYPAGMCMTVPATDLETIGCCDGDPGDWMCFSAMATVTSVMRGIKSCRIEAQVTQLGGEDGKFCEVSSPGCICFDRPTLEKMGLTEDAEKGDMIHLFGMARLDEIRDHEWSDAKMCALQITHLAFENESEEAREA